MPLIDIQVLEGVFDAKDKALIIERVTDAFVSVAGGTMKQGTSVRIHEIKSGDWGFAGVPLHTEDGLAMRAAKSDD